MRKPPMVMLQLEQMEFALKSPQRTRIGILHLIDRLLFETATRFKQALKGSHVIGRTSRVLGTLVALLAAGWLTMAPASADETYELNDTKLQSFVVAAKAVHEVVKASAHKISEVKTEEEAEALRVELDAKFEAAIEKTDGITLAEYKEIHEAATKDENLGQRIMEELQPATTAQ